MPGRQPLCLTLAGAQFGLEVCFNWGRGQRRGDAPTSSLCLSSSDLAEVEIFNSTQSDAAGGSGKTIPGKATPKKFCEAAAAAPAAPA